MLFWRSPTIAIPDRFVRRIRIRRYTLRPRDATLTAPVDVLDDMPAHDDHGAGRSSLVPTRSSISAAAIRQQLPGELLQSQSRAGVPTADEVGSATGAPIRARFCGSTSTDPFRPTIRCSRASAVTSTRSACGTRRGSCSDPEGLCTLGSRSEHGRRAERDRIGPELRLAERRRFQGRSCVHLRELVGVRPAPCRTLKFDAITIPPRAADEDRRGPPRTSRRR